MVFHHPLFKGIGDSELKLLTVRIKSKLTVCLVAALISWIHMQIPASAKVDVVIHTGESMKEHTSDEPRRQMHAVLVQGFNRGKLFNIVNHENVPQPSKHYDLSYHIGANLIAFKPSEKLPVRVSVTIQLVRYESGKVIMASDEAIDVPESVIYSSLRLHSREFDNSDYGKALNHLFLMAIGKFEEKCNELNLK